MFCCYSRVARKISVTRKNKLPGLFDLEILIKHIAVGVGMTKKQL
jgi:hypothetical protein